MSALESIKYEWNEYSEKLNAAGATIRQVHDELEELQPQLAELFDGASLEGAKVPAATAGAVKWLMEAITDLKLAIDAGDEYTRLL